jgi:hypothetical protein
LVVVRMSLAVEFTRAAEQSAAPQAVAAVHGGNRRGPRSL